MEKAKKAMREANDFLGVELQKGAAEIVPMACEQSSLESVRSFCAELRETVKDSGLDIVCLNAAMITPSTKSLQFTDDDLEITFQTNHLAPFLQANLLQDLLNDNGRVVVTSSGLHNGPSFHGFKGIVDDCGIIKKRFEMMDGSEFHNKAAYANSKLCNTTFCLELNQRLQKQGGNKIAIMFTPGLIPTSGLFRHGGVLLPVFQFTMNYIFKVGSSLEWGGGALAWMAVSDEAGAKGGQFFVTPKGSSHLSPTYGESFCAGPIPNEASSRENQLKLWEISSELCDIKPDMI